MELFLIIFISTLIILFLLTLISWLLHITQVQDSDFKPYGYATFKKFLQEFNKYSIDHENELIIDYEFGSPKSIILRYNTGKRIDYYPKIFISVNIISFEGKGMILYYPDWIKFLFWIRKYASKKDPSLWKDHKGVNNL